MPRPWPRKKEEDDGGFLGLIPDLLGLITSIGAAPFTGGASLAGGLPAISSAATQLAAQPPEPQSNPMFQVPESAGRLQLSAGAPTTNAMPPSATEPAQAAAAGGGGFPWGAALGGLGAATGLARTGMNIAQLAGQEDPQTPGYRLEDDPRLPLIVRSRSRFRGGRI